MHGFEIKFVKPEKGTIPKENSSRIFLRYESYPVLLCLSVIR